jgi:hypothetical protein
MEEMLGLKPKPLPRNRLHNPVVLLLFGWDHIENSFPYTVAYLEVFTDPLTGIVLIKSVNSILEFAVRLCQSFVFLIAICSSVTFLSQFFLSVWIRIQKLHCNTRDCLPSKCSYKGRQNAIQGIKHSSLIFPILHSSSPPSKRRMLPFCPAPKQYGNRNHSVAPEGIVPRKTGEAG